MHERELLARLNVPAVRYAVGRGAVPVLSNLDIAGALGLIEDRLAANLFSMLWWAECPRQVHEQVAKAFSDKLLTEYNRRCMAYSIAALEFHIAEENLTDRRFRNQFDRMLLGDLESKRERAHHERWPWNPRVYALCFPAVVAEMKSPRHCGLCGGRGERMKDNLLVKCQVCGGTGSRPQAHGWRAHALDVTESAYRQWRDVYEYCYGAVSGLEHKAAIAFSQSLDFIRQVA